MTATVGPFYQLGLTLNVLPKWKILSIFQYFGKSYNLEAVFENPVIWKKV